ncbi:MAG: L,D-transpeptidase [Rhizobium sp.]|nr:L,D-transpeptidase [Rhizobium sp.]
MHIDRRLFLKASGLTALATLAGCATTNAKTASGPDDDKAALELAAYDVMYAAQPGEQFPLPAIPYRKIKRQYLRQWVDNPTGERPGTLVVDVGNHYLYFTYPDGKAMRYGVGLGRAGFEWAGAGVIQYKRQWPRWTPPDEMVKRQPELERYSIANGGMDAGLNNPLGARALYIFQNNEDTLYRIHGSPEWHTIGKSVSSGCVRMLNQDIIDLYGRVPGKTRIVVTNLSNMV